MTLFWLAATGMIVLALALVLPAMMRRPKSVPAEHDHGHRTSDLLTSAAVLVLVPMLAVGLYYRLGSIQEVTERQAAAVLATGGDGKLPPVEVLVERLEERMSATPDDPRGWEMLGQTYMALGRYPEARDALAKALALVGDQPTLMARYAEAIARSEGGNLAGEPTELINRALAAEPDNPDALWLGGLAAYQRGDGDTTLGQWRRLLALQAPNSDSARTLKEHIARAEAQFSPAAANTTAVTTAEPSVPADVEQTAGATIAATVSLDPALVAQVAPGDTLFVYARAVQGPKMPLALVRGTAADLPLTVHLDDTMAMIPKMNLSAFQEVEVVARVSKAGTATRQPGDLTGSSAIVAVGKDLATDVIISSVVE